MNAVLFTSLVILVPAPRGMDEPVNSFAKAKVGDWVDYRFEFGQAPGGQLPPMGLPEMKLRTVITAATEKEATLEIQMQMGGGNQPNQTQKMLIDLTKPFDPLSFIDIGKMGGVKSEKKDEGREKLTVGNKTYDCTWISAKSGEPNMGDYKIWVSKDVPLTGILRLEAQTSGISIRFDMVGSGRK